jgi:hypothetical protein
VIYDIKYLMKSCENLKGGLQKVAEKLQVTHCTHIHIITHATDLVMCMVSGGAYR